MTDTQSGGSRWVPLAVATLTVGALAAATFAAAVHFEPRTVPAAVVTPSVAAVVGRPAPLFSGMGIDGGTVSLVAARGDVVLVTFFASWCTNCRDEFPAIEAAYTDERARGFAVIGVNTLETGDGPAFYHSLHASFPAVRDPGQPGNIAAEYDVVSGLPASFFIARDGTLADAHYGVIDAVYIQMELGRLL